MGYPDGGGLTAKQRVQRERMRFEAAEMFAAGAGPAQVARRLRVSRKSACAWRTAWQADGAGALCSKGPSGCPSRMKPSWRAWLEQALEEGPAVHGWVEDQRWTLERVVTLVARRFHVRFSTPRMSRILHRMGWSVPVPVPVPVQVHRAAERDEQAVATWIEETWPRVEKR